MNIEDPKLKDTLIVSQAFHHLEKSILLREKIFTNCEIINLQKNNTKLLSLQNNFNQQFISHFSSFKQIDLHNYQNFNFFIFFSFSPSLPFIKFIKEIKKNGKKIILIQDNHQFSIHQGAANSIIFKPDLIIAASDTEKAYIDSKINFNDIKVISNGWLFQNNENLQNKKIKSNEKKILIAFSAPSEITLVSNETYESRFQIISWINQKYPTHKIIIKLHPHENIERFNLHFKNRDLEFTLLSSQSSISHAILESDIVVSSNESQIPLDVIATDINKKIILYSYDKENFLIEDIELCSTESSINKSNIKLGTLQLSAREKIRDIHLSHGVDIFNQTAGNILELHNNNTNIDSMIDIFLWLYIYGQKSYIIKFLESQESDKYKNLLNLIKNKDVDIYLLDKDFKNQSTRDPICIILIRHFLSLKKINQEVLQYLIEKFFEEYLVQFFFRDLIRFHNLTLANGLPIFFEQKYLNLIKNIQFLYISKFRYFKNFFRLLKKVYALRVKFLSLLFLNISDRVFKI